MIDYKQKLEEFYRSDYARKTVQELLTSTSNIALPTMVQAKAILDLQNSLDTRELCKNVAVPKGAGKTVNVQVITRPDYDDWSEGSALAAADPALATKTATIAPFGKVTQISDILANTSAINFVEEIGKVHGACIRQGILDKVVDVMAAASSANTVSLGTAADGTEADIALSNVATAIEKIAESGFSADFILTSPGKMWTAFTTDYSVTQFSGALANMLSTGKIPNVLGLDWYVDPYFEQAINAAAWDGTDGEQYAIIGQKEVSGIWAAMQRDPVVEIYRKGQELSNYIVSHIDGGATEGPDGSICIIDHAS